MPPNNAREYIGYVEAQVSNVRNPFEKDKIRRKLTRDLCLYRLPESEAEKVRRHYENQYEESAFERAAFLAQKLKLLRAQIWGRLTEQ